MTVFLLILFVFLLAILLGFEVIAKVPPILHTPLMSGANAISGITLVGALTCAKTGYAGFANLLGCVAIAAATVNVVGGFLVTDRMLGMFTAKRKPGAGAEPGADARGGGR